MKTTLQHTNYIKLHMNFFDYSMGYFYKINCIKNKYTDHVNDKSN